MYIHVVTCTHRYPDATTEELQTANTVCIICREDMVQRCKKLPCGHIFHTTCLRSWFQRQQVCPTCRYCIYMFYEIIDQGAVIPCIHILIKINE